MKRPITVPAILALLIAGIGEARGNLIVNGDFESGNVGFATGYSYSGGVPGGLLTLGNSGAQYYDISTNPQYDHPYFTSFGDHTTGTGNMMVVNGSVLPVQDTPASGTTLLWQQTVSVAPGWTYGFSMWGASAYPANPASIDLLFNGVSAGTFNLNSSPSWQSFSSGWHSVNATTVTISLVDRNTYFTGNDFAIDDLSFSPTSHTNVGSAAPEPASLAMLGVGIVGMAGYGLKRKLKRA